MNAIWERKLHFVLLAANRLTNTISKQNVKAFLFILNGRVHFYLAILYFHVILYVHAYFYSFSMFM